MTGPQLATSLRTILLRSDEQIALYRRELQEKEAFNVHLRAVIAIIENGGLTADRPSSARMSVAGIFKRNEIYTHCIKTLEDANTELSTRQLAEACMLSRGLDPTDGMQRGRMMQIMIEVLNVHKDKGQIVSSRKEGKLKFWQLQPGI